MRTESAGTSLSVDTWAKPAVQCSSAETPLPRPSLPPSRERSTPTCCPVRFICARRASWTSELSHSKLNLKFDNGTTRNKQASKREERARRGRDPVNPEFPGFSFGIAYRISAVLFDGAYTRLLLYGPNGTAAGGCRAVKIQNLGPVSRKSWPWLVAVPLALIIILSRKADCNMWCQCN